MKRSIIFTAVGFALGFVSGAIVNELQQKRKGSKKQAKKEVVAKSEEKLKEPKETPEEKKIFESKESIVMPEEVKASYTNYSGRRSEELMEEDLPTYILSDRASYADNQALGQAAQYECIDLYFNINDGVCTDENAEEVAEWEYLLGPECCDELKRQIGREYEDIPVNKRAFYVKNNSCESFFQVSLIVE